MFKSFKKWASDKWDYLNTPYEEDDEKIKKQYYRVADWAHQELSKAARIGDKVDYATIKAVTKRTAKTYFGHRYTDDKYKRALEVLNKHIETIGLIECNYDSKQKQQKSITEASNTMLKFGDFLAEQEQLEEKLMVFGRKPYPRFGHVVILAGGAGSGKGFQLEKLLGIQGQVFDVDALKKAAQKSTEFRKRIKDETGLDIGKDVMDLKTPENVSKLHQVLSDVYNLPNKKQQTAFLPILAAPAHKKTNLIFDVTLKDMGKLEKITRNVQELGYDKENIHIVWVVNDVEVAVRQNQSRDRVVPHEILMATHQGAAATMKNILDMGDKLKKYMDGDIYLTFNRAGIDTEMATSELPGKGGYVTKADYIKVKKQGRPQISTKEMGNDIINKIRDMVPNIANW